MGVAKDMTRSTCLGCAVISFICVVACVFLLYWCAGCKGWVSANGAAVRTSNIVSVQLRVWESIGKNALWDFNISLNNYSVRGATNIQITCDVPYTAHHDSLGWYDIALPTNYYLHTGESLNLGITLAYTSSCPTNISGSVDYRGASIMGDCAFGSPWGTGFIIPVINKGGVGSGPNSTNLSGL